jgi:uncharacterized membrane protein
MNQAHIHLIITHLPIFGTLLGSIVLIQGVWSKSDSTVIAGYSLFIISAFGACIAYITGEGAEESVENLPRILEETIREHEEFALVALIGLVILGFLSMLGFYFTYKKSSLLVMIAFSILTVSIFCFGLVGYTGYLGGQIRHSEIGNSAGELDS